MYVGHLAWDGCISGSRGRVGGDGRINRFFVLCFWFSEKGIRSQSLLPQETLSLLVVPQVFSAQKPAEGWYVELFV